MTDILELIEPAEYPDGADDLTIAMLSQAASLRRIADHLANPLVAASSTIAAPAKRVLGGLASAVAKPDATHRGTTPAALGIRERDETSLAAGRPIPDEPVLNPGGWFTHDGSAMPVDRAEQVFVVWRNGFGSDKNKPHRGAAQQFQWKWNPAQPQAHDILYYVIEQPDPAKFSAPSAELNVPLVRSGAEE